MSPITGDSERIEKGAVLEFSFYLFPFCLTFFFQIFQLCVYYTVRRGVQSSLLLTHSTCTLLFYFRSLGSSSLILPSRTSEALWELCTSKIGPLEGH